MIEIIDISMEISKDVQVYKNKEEKKPRFEITNKLQEGGRYESKAILNLHTATHIDAPLHMNIDGKTTGDYPLEKFIVKCKVLDFTENTKCIKKQDLLKKNIEDGDTILLKTKNSYTKEFDFDFIYLEESGARYLSSLKLNGVGIDGLGIERGQSNHISHQLLFDSDTFILEGLRLKDVEEGEYELIALPLKIKGVEASLVRAVLLKRDND